MTVGYNKCQKLVGKHTFLKLMFQDTYLNDKVRPMTGHESGFQTGVTLRKVAGCDHSTRLSLSMERGVAGTRICYEAV